MLYRGIYIVANDRVLENSIALLNSIRHHNPEISVILIPFNQEYEQVFHTLNQFYQVELFPNLEFLEDLTQTIGSIFDQNFLKLPNKMRKLAVWFGPLTEFLYIDTDIIVFEDIGKNLNYLSEFDFFCCDYHYLNEQLKNIFSPDIREKDIFTDRDLQDVFNSGFWGSKTGIFTEKKLYEVLRECARHREYFDFSRGVTDQPILNYLVLKLLPKRANLVKLQRDSPGSWAGTPHFRAQDFILYDGDQPLKYLHWAGIPLEKSAYYQLWQYYRYWRDPRTQWQRKLNQLLPFLYPEPGVYSQKKVEDRE